MSKARSLIQLRSYEMTVGPGLPVVGGAWAERTRLLKCAYLPSGTRPSVLVRLALVYYASLDQSSRCWRFQVAPQRSGGRRRGSHVLSVAACCHGVCAKHLRRSRRCLFAGSGCLQLLWSFDEAHQRMVLRGVGFEMLRWPLVDAVGESEHGPILYGDVCRIQRSGEILPTGVCGGPSRRCLPPGGGSRVRLSSAVRDLDLRTGRVGALVDLFAAFSVQARRSVICALGHRLSSSAFGAWGDNP